jgi:hypothetical protein
VGAGAGTPSQLVFFSRTTAGQVAINGGPTNFVGVIYAPNIPVTLNGTGSYSGACVASRVILNSAVAVHYDQDLGNGCNLGASRALAVKDPGPGGSAAAAGKPLVVVPNPAHDRVQVAFHLDGPAHVRLLLMDVSGARVGTLDLGPQPAGQGQVAWDLRGYAAGLYFVVGLADPGSGVHEIGLFKLALLGP